MTFHQSMKTNAWARSLVLVVSLMVAAPATATTTLSMHGGSGGADTVRTDDVQRRLADWQQRQQLHGRSGSFRFQPTTTKHNKDGRRLAGGSDGSVSARIPASRHRLQMTLDDDDDDDDSMEGLLPPGIWNPRGYAYVLNVSLSDSGQADVDVLEETAISCIRNNALLEYIEGFHVVATDENGAARTALVDTGINVPWVFDRVDTFVAGCADGLTPTVFDDDPAVREAFALDWLQIYDIFVQTFAEHYAFFDLRGVDWPTSTATTRLVLEQQEQASLTPTDVFIAMAELVIPLEDGHVNLIADDIGGFYTKPGPFIRRLVDEYTTNVTGDIVDETFDDYMLRQTEAIYGGLLSYMDEETIKSSSVYDTILWAKIDPARTGGRAIGYLLMDTFDSQGRLDLFETELDKVFTNLAECEAMVIDHRANSGGDDTAARLLASYFASERALAYTQKAVLVGTGGNYTERQPVYMDPMYVTNHDSLAFTNKRPIVVMMSGEDASAGENFVQFMMALPDQTATLLGQNTAGEFSTVLEKVLPNGWIFSASNEVYEAPDGTIYEKVGIPPDVRAPTPVFPLEDRLLGIDTWLELAITTVVSQLPVESSNSVPTQAPSTLRSTTPSPTASAAFDAHGIYSTTFMAGVVALGFVTYI